MRRKLALWNRVLETADWEKLALWNHIRTSYLGLEEDAGPFADLA